VHLHAEPLDVYLEGALFDELRSFFVSLPFDDVTFADRKQQKTLDATEVLLRSMLQTATRQTTIADPKDLFGKWCVPLISSP
jgi:hypothetical protein